MHVLSTLCLLILAMGVTLGQESTKTETVAPNLQTLAPLAKKPVIDGLFSDGEWEECASDHVFISEATGQKALRDTFIYYGYDSEGFYFCQLGDVPKKPQSLSAQDVVELTLALPTKTFRFTITPDGGKGLPAGIRICSRFSGKQFVGQGFATKAKWIVETAIPWRALGETKAPENTLWRMQVRRIWKNPDEIACLDVPLLFASETVMVASRIALYDVSARVSGLLVNRSAQPRTVNLDITITSQEVPHRQTTKLLIPRICSL